MKLAFALWLGVFTRVDDDGSRATERPDEPPDREAPRESFIEAVLPEGTSYETRIVAEPALKALLETARRRGADEIVLGASASRAARGAVGRVADTALRHSERPVTIVPRGA
jgi:nucleotide-binding universal stress UspA family protein